MSETIETRRSSTVILCCSKKQYKSYIVVYYLYPVSYSNTVTVLEYMFVFVSSFSSLITGFHPRIRVEINENFSQNFLRIITNICGCSCAYFPTTNSDGLQCEANRNILSNTNFNNHKNDNNVNRLTML